MTYTYGIFPIVVILGCGIAYLFALASKQPFNDLKLLSVFGVSPAIAVPLTKLLFDPTSANLTLRGLLVLMVCCFFLTTALIAIIRIFKPDYVLPLTEKRLADIDSKGATKACIFFSLASVILLFLAINITLFEPCKDVRCKSAEILFGSKERITSIVLMFAFLQNAFFSFAVFSAMSIVSRSAKKT